MVSCPGRKGVRWPPYLLLPPGRSQDPGPARQVRFPCEEASAEGTHTEERAGLSGQGGLCCTAYHSHRIPVPETRMVPSTSPEGPAAACAGCPVCGVCRWGGHRPPGLQFEATGGTHGFQHGSWNPPPHLGLPGTPLESGNTSGSTLGIKAMNGSQKHAMPIPAPSPNASLGQPYCLRDDCGCLSRGSCPQSWPSAPTFREREAVLFVETT